MGEKTRSATALIFIRKSFLEVILCATKKQFSLCITCGYLLDVLNATEDDIVIEYNTKESDKPIVVRPANKNNITYIIMPMIMS